MKTYAVIVQSDNAYAKPWNVYVDGKWIAAFKTKQEARTYIKQLEFEPR